MAEYKYAKGRIIESAQFILGEMNEFDKEYAGKTDLDYKNDKKLQKLMDRTVENILTALIEICGTVLTERGVAVESYTQVVKECAKLFKFTEKEQESLSKLAIQRNRLAHRYLNFRWEAICIFKKTKSTVSSLLAKILEKEGR